MYVGPSINRQSGVAGLSGLSIWLLDRLSSKTSFWRDPYCIYVHIYFHPHPLTGLISQTGEQHEAIGAVGGSALFSVCVDPCGLLCAYACMYCMYVYMCAYWGLRLITDWTWEHGAAAASTLMGYQFGQLLTISTLVSLSCPCNLLFSLPRT